MPLLCLDLEEDDGSRSKGRISTAKLAAVPGDAKYNDL